MQYSGDHFPLRELCGHWAAQLRASFILVAKVDDGAVALVDVPSACYSGQHTQDYVYEFWKGRWLPCTRWGAETQCVLLEVYGVHGRYDAPDPEKTRDWHGFTRARLEHRVKERLDMGLHDLFSPQLRLVHVM